MIYHNIIDLKNTRKTLEVKKMLFQKYFVIKF